MIAGTSVTQDLLDAFEMMSRMRYFEEAVGAATASGEIHGEMHLGIGHEAVAVALSRHLRPGDVVVSTHRPHLHALALGVDPVAMLAELLERDGLNRGKGGHMHLFSDNFMCTGIVGADAPIAAGYALAQSRAGGQAVTVAVLGDGAMNQGAVFEVMNLAAVQRLPVLFLCEDNAYGISVRREVSTAGELARRGEPFGIPGTACDGVSVEAVDAALSNAFRVTRDERRPALVVATVYRFRGHYEGDPDHYRSRTEKDEAMQRLDPLLRLQARLVEAGVSRNRLDEIAKRSIGAVEGWLDDARNRPYPPISTARDGVFADGQR